MNTWENQNAIPKILHPNWKYNRKYSTKKPIYSPPLNVKMDFFNCPSRELKKKKWWQITHYISSFFTQKLWDLAVPPLLANVNDFKLSISLGIENNFHGFLLCDICMNVSVFSLNIREEVEIKTKLNKWDLMKLTSFCPAKETIKKKKRKENL